MWQLFVIVAPTYYRTPDSHTHIPIAHLGLIVKDRGPCVCQIHGHRAWDYLYFEKTNCPPGKDNIVLLFPFEKPSDQFLGLIVISH
jgi:hypothetical protein